MKPTLHRSILFAGALMAATGIGFGAFGAHALRTMLGPEQLGWWQTAVQYQMWHAVGLVAIAVLPLPKIQRAAGIVGLGVAIFSGSLYIMALSGPRWLGAATPLGGILMILGWLMLAWQVRRRD